MSLKRVEALLTPGLAVLAYTLLVWVTLCGDGDVAFVGFTGLVCVALFMSMAESIVRIKEN